MGNQAGTPGEIARLVLERIIAEMRSERSRYKSHDLGFVDSVSSNRVDDWADELVELRASLAAPPTTPETK
jgi:hypothetical protein